jgi:hypothetical protein
MIAGIALVAADAAHRSNSGTHTPLWKSAATNEEFGYYRRHLFRLLKLAAAVPRVAPLLNSLRLDRRQPG